MTFFVPFASAQTTETESKEIYANGKVWFDLNGNSRLFVKSDEEAWTNRATYDKYLPGVDFASYLATATGDFNTDFAYATGTGEGFSGPVAVFPYTLNLTSTGTIEATSVPNFTTDANGNTVWTIDGVPYIIKPTKKVIKLYKDCNTSAISKNDKLTDKQKEDLTSAYNSLAEVTIDVADGQYEKVGFLAGIFYTNSTWNRI